MTKTLSLEGGENKTPPEQLAGCNLRREGKGKRSTIGIGGNCENVSAFLLAVPPVQLIGIQSRAGSMR